MKNKFLKFLAPSVLVISALISTNTQANIGNSSLFNNYLNNYAELLTKEGLISNSTAPEVKLVDDYKAFSISEINVVEQSVDCSVVMGQKALVDPNSYSPKIPFFKYVQDLALNKKETELKLNTMFILSHELAHCDFAYIENRKELLFVNKNATFAQNVLLTKGVFNNNSMVQVSTFKTLLNELYADIYGTATLLKTFLYSNNEEAQLLAKNLNLDTAQILDYAHKFAHVRKETDLSSTKLDYSHLTYKGMNILLQPENIEKIKQLSSAEDVRKFSLELTGEAFIDTLLTHPEIMKEVENDPWKVLGQNIYRSVLVSSDLILNKSGISKKDVVFDITKNVLSKKDKKYVFEDNIIKESGFNETHEVIKEVFAQFQNNPNEIKNMLTEFKSQIEILNTIAQKTQKQEFNVEERQLIEKKKIKLN